MSDFLKTFDPNNHVAAKKLFDAGTYQAWVTRYNDQIDDKGWVVFDWEFTNGKYKGDTISQFFRVATGSQASMNYAHDMMAKLARELNLSAPIESWDSFLHKPVGVIISNSKYEGELQSQISGYKPNPVGSHQRSTTPQNHPQPPLQTYDESSDSNNDADTAVVDDVPSDGGVPIDGGVPPKTNWRSRT